MTGNQSADLDRATEAAVVAFASRVTDPAEAEALIRAIFNDPELEMRPEQLAVVDRYLRAFARSANLPADDERIP